MLNQRNAVVAFGFGEPSSANPNAKIAEKAICLARRIGAATIYTDRDVAPHLSRGRVQFEEIDPERIPTTYRLAVFAAEGAEIRGLGELHIVAAPCHMWRCCRDLRWAMRACGIAITLVPHVIEGYQYDPAAATSFTRSAWRWWPPEIAYRIASWGFLRWYKRTRA